MTEKATAFLKQLDKACHLRSQSMVEECDQQSSRTFSGIQVVMNHGGTIWLRMKPRALLFPPIWSSSTSREHGQDVWKLRLPPRTMTKPFTFSGRKFCMLKATTPLAPRGLFVCGSKTAIMSGFKDHCRMISRNPFATDPCRVEEVEPALAKDPPRGRL